MTILAVLFVLHVVLATAVKCDVLLKQTASQHKASSTTLLRLTALRDDEGLWVARFGEYEISIELRRHPKSAWRKKAEDTWALKITHTSRRFETTCNEDESYNNNNNNNNELPSQRQSAKTNKAPWQQIIDQTDGDAEDVNVQIFTKLRRPGKSRKGKSRRQLSPKSHLRRNHNETSVSTANTATRPFAQEPPILNELVQGKERFRRPLDGISNDTRQLENTDEVFEGADETPGGNVAAVMYDSTENHKTTVENTPDQQTDEPRTNSTESSVTYKHEKLTEPYALYALAVQQSEDDKGPDTDSLEDTNKSKIKDEYDDNADKWKGPEVVDSADYGDRMTRFTTEGTDAADTSDRQQPTDIMSDYVIEDSTLREYDVEDVGNQQQQDRHDVMDNGQRDFEPTSEMKRIMNWFPRSRLLTTGNNGYKLFPGVGWFKLVTWPERWSNARRSCEMEQAHLAIPDSRQKVSVLLQIFQNYPDVLEQAILHKQVYVGVHSSGQDRNFSTVLGRPFHPEFPIWFPNEPDNADPGEECVTFHAEGKLRDVPCFYNLPFLCEKQLDVP